MSKKLERFNEIILVIILSLFLTNNYSRISSLILILLGGFNIYKNRRYNWKGIEKYILVYFGIQLASIAFGIDMEHSLKQYYRHLYMLIPLFTVTQIILSYKEKVKILDISMGIVTLYYFIYINLQKYEFIRMLPKTEDRYRGFGTDGTIVKYAFVIGVITLYYWFKILRKKESQKYYLDVIMLLLNLYLIILSGTRGAWLGILGSMSLVYIIYSENIIKCIRNTFITMLSFLGASVALLKLDIFYNFKLRILSIGNIETDASNTARIEMWKVAYKYFKDKKLLGHGYRPNIWYKVSTGSFDHPHNDYFQILVGSGILGLLSYFYMMGGLILKGVKNKKESIWLYVIGIIIFIMIYGVVETLIQLSIVLNIFIFILSLI